MTDTVALWRGDWGDAYHDRNRFQPEHVRPVFQRILGHLEPFDSVLEVGCGRGANLMAIDSSFRVGVEPNEAARREANEMYADPLALEFNVVDGTAAALPFKDDSFDLVLTCGLLIHIPPEQIRKVVEEIARVSRKYVLCIEYAAAEEEAVTYRGVKDILWRRNYGTLMIAWGGMKQIGHDDADSNLYPGCSWWLFEKGER